MGEVLSLIGQARQAKSSLRGDLGLPASSGSNYDPGVSLPDTPPLTQAFDPVAQSIGSPQPQGFAMATPQLSPQQVDPTAAPASSPAPTAAPDNPYVDDTPKELADDNSDITVNGDRFQPKKESLLGKIADTLLILRGRQPVFRQRTDEANMQEAMKGYDRDPDAAIRRVNQVDSNAAQRLRVQQSQMDANNMLQEERVQAMREKGLERLGAFAGAIQSAKDPSGAYTQMLPTLRSYADQYHLDGKSMFPDSYDSDNLNGIKNGSMSAAQQAALANQSQTNARITASQDRTATETERHNKAMEALSQGRLNVAEDKAAKGKPSIKNVFNQDTGASVGTISPDGRVATLQGDDGQWYAFVLRTPGDINTRVRAPGYDAIIRKKFNVKQ